MRLCFHFCKRKNGPHEFQCNWDCVQVKCTKIAALDWDNVESNQYLCSIRFDFFATPVLEWTFLPSLFRIRSICENHMKFHFYLRNTQPNSFFVYSILSGPFCVARILIEYSLGRVFQPANRPIQMWWRCVCRRFDAHCARNHICVKLWPAFDILIMPERFDSVQMVSLNLVKIKYLWKNELQPEQSREKSCAFLRIRPLFFVCSSLAKTIDIQPQPNLKQSKTKNFGNSIFINDCCWFYAVQPPHLCKSIAMRYQSKMLFIRFVKVSHSNATQSQPQSIRTLLSYNVETKVSDFVIIIIVMAVMFEAILANAL